MSSAKNEGIGGEGTQKVMLRKVDATFPSFSFLTGGKKVENKKAKPRLQGVLNLWTCLKMHCELIGHM